MTEKYIITILQKSCPLVRVEATRDGVSGMNATGEVVLHVKGSGAGVMKKFNAAYGKALAAGLISKER